MASSPESRDAVKRILLDLRPYLNERQKRLLYGSAAAALGYGGMAFVKEVTGSARGTIRSGMEELAASGTDGDQEQSRVRRKGAGRKGACEKYPNLHEVLEKIIRRSGEGNEVPLSWTTMSLRKMDEELRAEKINVSLNVISRELETLGYSKTLNRKTTLSGRDISEKEVQFRLINQTASDFLAAGEPVVFLDTLDQHAIERDGPGVQWAALDAGLDPRETAGESLRQWWLRIGKRDFPEAKKLYVVCNGEGKRVNRGKRSELIVQAMAEEEKLDILVSLFPSGTTRWNRIASRLLCGISKDGQQPRILDVTAYGMRPETTASGAEKAERKAQLQKTIEAVSAKKPWNQLIVAGY